MNTTKRQNAPQKPRKPPEVLTANEIKLGIENGILKIFQPVKIDGFDMVFSVGVDIAKIPDDEWLKMCEARSKIVLLTPPKISILH